MSQYPRDLDRTVNAPDLYGREEDLNGKADDHDNDYPKDIEGDVPNESNTIEYISAKDRIAQMDLQRSELVHKRRNPTSPFMQRVGKIIPYGGLLSSGFNLLSSSIGSGIIGLPSAFNTSGLGMSIIYIVIIGSLTTYSFTCLAYAGKRTGLRNYEEITRVLLGPGSDYFLAFCLWFISFGSDITYVISTQNVIHTFVVSSKSSPEYLTTTSGQRLLTAMVWLVFMLPMCLPKEINSLRYMSFLAIFLILFFVVCMIVHSAMSIHARGGVPNDLVYFETGNRAVVGLGTFMFAFICQMNTYGVMEEMYKPGVKRMSYAGTIIAILASVVYFCAGLFGYLDFGGALNDSVLLYYNPIEDKWMAVAYAGIILKMTVAYALHMIPVRDSTYHIFGTNVKNVNWWVNAAVCTTWALISLILGLFIPSVNIVFGVVGSFSGGFIGFIYPALLFMYCGSFSPSTVGWFHYCMTYILLIVGVIGVVFGTIAAIYGEVVKYHPNMA